MPEPAPSITSDLTALTFYNLAEQKQKQAKIAQHLRLRLFSGQIMSPVNLSGSVSRGFFFLIGEERFVPPICNLMVKYEVRSTEKNI